MNTRVAKQLLTKYGYANVSVKNLTPVDVLWVLDGQRETNEEPNEFEKPDMDALGLTEGKSLFPCTYCKSENVTYAPHQRKAGDEGSTVEGHCLDCKRSFRSQM